MNLWKKCLTVAILVACAVPLAWFLDARRGRNAAAGGGASNLQSLEGLGVVPGSVREPAPASVALPGDAPGLDGEAALRSYVEWLRSLGHDELLRLSNAEFDFQKSELIESLQELEGPWVVSVLGNLASTETDPLLKAVLVEGLLGGVNLQRLGDPELLPILDTLVQQ